MKNIATLCPRLWQKVTSFPVIGMISLSGSMENGIENSPYIQYQIWAAIFVYIITLTFNTITARQPGLK